MHEGTRGFLSSQCAVPTSQKYLDILWKQLVLYGRVVLKCVHSSFIIELLGWWSLAAFSSPWVQFIDTTSNTNHFLPGMMMLRILKWRMVKSVFKNSGLNSFYLPPFLFFFVTFWRHYINIDSEPTMLVPCGMYEQNPFEIGTNGLLCVLVRWIGRKCTKT